MYVYGMFFDRYERVRVSFKLNEKIVQKINDLFHDADALEDLSDDLAESDMGVDKWSVYNFLINRAIDNRRRVKGSFTGIDEEVLFGFGETKDDARLKYDRALKRSRFL
jgi:hypothetical protein